MRMTLRGPSRILVAQTTVRVSSSAIALSVRSRFG